MPQRLIFAAGNAFGAERAVARPAVAAATPHALIIWFKYNIFGRPATLATHHRLLRTEAIVPGFDSRLNDVSKILVSKILVRLVM